MEINKIIGQIVDAAMKVHSTLGPGLLESAYELLQRDLPVQTQVALPVLYGEVKLDVRYRIDILVEGMVVVELKAVEYLLPIHEAQLLTCLKLSNCKLGLLINFNMVLVGNRVDQQNGYIVI